MANAWHRRGRCRSVVIRRASGLAPSPLPSPSPYTGIRMVPIPIHPPCRSADPRRRPQRRRCDAWVHAWVLHQYANSGRRVGGRVDLCNWSGARPGHATPRFTLTLDVLMKRFFLVNSYYYNTYSTPRVRYKGKHKETRRPAVPAYLPNPLPRWEPGHRDTDRPLLHQGFHRRYRFSGTDFVPSWAVSARLHRRRPCFHSRYRPRSSRWSHKVPLAVVGTELGQMGIFDSSGHDRPGREKCRNHRIASTQGILGPEKDDHDETRSSCD
jgi:hypothetical protein